MLLNRLFGLAGAAVSDPEGPDPEEPEEELEENLEEKRYEKYRPDVYRFDDTDFDELIREDEELLRGCTGHTWILRREYYGLKLQVDRQGREIKSLKSRVEVSADKKFLDEAIKIRDQYYELLDQSVRDAATIDVQTEELNRKDSIIDNLKAQIEQINQQNAREKEALMRTIQSLSSTKAVHRNVMVEPENAPEDDPKKQTQFTSQDGMTGPEKKAAAYWLYRLGISKDEISELIHVKDVSKYIRLGLDLLKAQKVSVKIDGSTFYETADKLDPKSGELPDYPGIKPEGYEFPALVTEKLKTMKDR